MSNGKKRCVKNQNAQKFIKKNLIFFLEPTTSLVHSTLMYGLESSNLYFQQ